MLETILFKRSLVYGIVWKKLIYIEVGSPPQPTEPTDLNAESENKEPVAPGEEEPELIEMLSFLALDNRWPRGVPAQNREKCARVEGPPW